MSLIGPYSNLPENLPTLEVSKFELAEDGYVQVRTSAKGTFQPTGLKEGGKITEVALNTSSWTALPPTGLTNRRQINIQNLSGTEIKINYSASVVGYVGVVIPNGGERQYLLEQNVIIYAKAASSTPTVNIEEIA